MYIVMDLEWNQLFPGQRGKANAKGMVLRNEIIQIGAAKLNKTGEVVDTFSTYVRPLMNKKLNPNITKVTGLTLDMLRNGPSFPEAIETMQNWCGEDCTILTWGRDDLPVFLSNLEYHGCPVDSWEKWYDAQAFFARQNELEKRQYSLKDAVQFYAMEMEASLHDAMNDAMYAARICQKLDLERGIREAGQPEKMPNESMDPELFPTDRSAVQKGLKMKYTCPYCGTDLIHVQPFVRKSQHRLLSIGECSEHGKMTIQFRCWANGKAHWKLAYQVEKMQQDEETRYQKLRGRVLRYHERVRRKTAEDLERQGTE